MTVPKDEARRVLAAIRLCQASGYAVVDRETLDRLFKDARASVVPVPEDGESP